MLKADWSYVVGNTDGKEFHIYCRLRKSYKTSVIPTSFSPSICMEDMRCPLEVMTSTLFCHSCIISSWGGRVKLPAMRAVAYRAWKSKCFVKTSSSSGCGRSFYPGDLMGWQQITVFLWCGWLYTQGPDSAITMVPQWSAYGRPVVDQWLHYGKFVRILL